MAVQRLAEPPIYDLNSDYRIAGDDAVSQLLGNSSFLAAVLREIAREINACFNATSISLKTSRDPDKVDAHQLAVYIHTDLPPRDALAKLHEFDEGWWLENQHRARGLISVDVAPAWVLTGGNT